MNRMILLAVFIVGVSLLLVAGTWLDPAARAQVDDGPRTPVLVELFTSEGCSSCPPADELLIALVEQQPVPGALVIPLSEHVDYWNRLGWQDPFSAPRFSDRQQEYKRALGTQSLYTPQMVIDGRMEMIGSLGERVRAAVARAAATPKPEVTLEVTGPGEDGALAVAVSVFARADVRTPADTELWLAVTEEGLETDVTHGENAFRRLRHAAVVRRLVRVTSLPTPLLERFDTGVDVPLEPEWQVDRIRVVAFLQERDSRRVLGAGQHPVARE